jgi:hypothetical protein
MFTCGVPSAADVFLRTAPRTPDDQQRAEESFFKNIRLRNGTRKTTAPGRLADVDRLLVRSLPPKERVSVLDVGISSGVTTLELLEHLDQQGVQVTGVGVDTCVRAYLRSMCGVDFLFDPARALLQIATPFFARGRPDHNRRSLAGKLLALGMNCLESPFVCRRLLDPDRSRPMMLVTSRLLERKCFSVVEHDVSRPMPEWRHAFDVIRAANVLNRAYFSEIELVMMAKNLTSWLADGGLLAVCRTNDADGSNHGSIFRKDGSASGLQLVDRIGHGSEIEPLIQAVTQ